MLEKTVIVLMKLCDLAVAALRSLKDQWQNTPPSWGKSDDPCGAPWEGVNCSNSRVVSLYVTLFAMNNSISFRFTCPLIPHRTFARGLKSEVDTSGDYHQWEYRVNSAVILDSSLN